MTDMSHCFIFIFSVSRVYGSHSGHGGSSLYASAINETITATLFRSPLKALCAVLSNCLPGLLANRACSKLLI